MWNIISILILIVETVLLLGFIVGRFQKRRLNETALFIGVLIVVNYSLHLVPFLYGVLELGKESNVILGMLDCLGATIKLFVGEANKQLREKKSDENTSNKKEDETSDGDK